jgi:hypothetical protein
VSQKSKTLDQVERMQDKAVQFLRDIVGDDDKADDFDEMTAEEYATHKGITISDNPEISRRSYPMADASKAELSNTLDDIQDVLDDALAPELTREELVAKVKEAYSLASGEDENEDETAGADEDDDSQGE